MKVYVLMTRREWEGHSLIGVGSDLVAALNMATEHCEDSILWSSGATRFIAMEGKTERADGLSYEIHERELDHLDNAV